jgi:hypothetical protein
MELVDGVGGFSPPMELAEWSWWMELADGVSRWSCRVELANA